VTETTTLDTVADQLDDKHQVAICVDGTGAPIAAFGALDLIQYLATAAKAAYGLVAPAEHTVNDLLAAIDVSNAWIAMPSSDPLANAVDRLMQKGINVVIGMDAEGAVTGVIPRALRRY